MKFDSKVKILRKLREANIKTASDLQKLDTREMIKLVGTKNLIGLLDLRDNSKDLFSYLMNDEV